MVEPISLTLGGVVAALVMNAAEKGGGAVGSGVVAALSSVGKWLKARFRRDDDADGARAVDTAEDAFDSPRARDRLAAVIDAKAAADQSFAEELRGLVKDAEAGGVDVQAITQTAWGSQISQNANIVDSTITTTIGGQPGSGPSG